jgi:hypothetical protein
MYVTILKNNFIFYYDINNIHPFIMPSLNSLNLSAAIMHFVLAIGFSIYFAVLNNKYPNQPIQGVELSMRDHVLELNDITDGSCESSDTTYCDSSGNGIVSEWKSKVTANVDIKVIQGLLVSFFFITGSFHLFYYLGNGNPEDEPTWRNGYSRAIKNSNNFYRWIEYSMTATMMLYIIAYTSGVKDTNIYLLLFATNVTMISLGQTIEVAIRDGKDWKLPMFTSFLLLIMEFVVIIRSFWQRLSQVNSFLTTSTLPSMTNGRTIPSWLNVMIIILFVFFACFGFVSLYGAYANTKYESLEKTYIILSFVAKATLGAFIAYGTAQRQQGWRQNP